MGLQAGRRASQAVAAPEEEERCIHFCPGILVGQGWCPVLTGLEILPLVPFTSSLHGFSVCKVQIPEKDTHLRLLIFGQITGEYFCYT